MDRGREENETGCGILTDKRLCNCGAFSFLLTNLPPQPKIPLMKLSPEAPMVTTTMIMRSMEMSSRVWIAR